MTRDDYSVLEDAQVSPSNHAKLWEGDDQLVWKLDVVQHCRLGVLPFGRIILRGAFDGTLTIHLEGDE